MVASNNTIRAQYEKLITSHEERALYEEWGKVWDAYKKGTLDVMELSRKSAGKIPQEANVLNTKTVNPIGLKADELLNKDIELNNARRRHGRSRRSRHIHAAFLMLAVILVVSALLGIGIGVYLVKDVSSAGIASIVKPMQALGQGDLTAHVPHQGEKTEIGTMGDALQVFKQALIDKRAADEAAAPDAEAKIERGRRVDSITREFESMIGEIVETVSSASTEAGSLRRHADCDRRTFAGTDHDGGSSVGRSLDQCAVGCFGDRRDGLVGQRDQPSGAGIGAHRQSGRRSGAQDQRSRQRAGASGRPHRRRRRADQQHRRPDQPSGAERHHRSGARRRSRSWLSRSWLPK